MRPGDDPAAFAQENLGLARLCAHRFEGRGIDYDDLYQAGCLGLLQAAKRFEPERGLKFSTYAVPVILGEIRRLFREGGAVKLSRGMQELSRKAKDAQESLEEQLGHSPGLGEIAAALGVSPEKTALALEAGRRPVSLSGEDEDGGGMDIPVQAPEEALTERLGLRQVLESLPEEDRLLLQLRYYQGLTQVKTAQRLGMSQVQVSRRERKILLVLREKLEGN